MKYKLEINFSKETEGKVNEKDKATFASTCYIMTMKAIEPVFKVLGIKASFGDLSLDDVKDDD